MVRPSSLGRVALTRGQVARWPSEQLVIEQNKGRDPAGGWPGGIRANTGRDPAVVSGEARCDKRVPHGKKDLVKLEFLKD